MLNEVMSPTNSRYGDRVIGQVVRSLCVDCPHAWYCSNIPLVEVVKGCYTCGPLVVPSLEVSAHPLKVGGLGNEVFEWLVTQ